MKIAITGFGMLMAGVLGYIFALSQEEEVFYLPEEEGSVEYEYPLTDAVLTKEREIVDSLSATDSIEEDVREAYDGDGTLYRTTLHFQYGEPMTKYELETETELLLIEDIDTLHLQKPLEEGQEWSEDVGDVVNSRSFHYEVTDVEERYTKHGMDIPDVIEITRSTEEQGEEQVQDVLYLAPGVGLVYWEKYWDDELQSYMELKGKDF